MGASDPHKGGSLEIMLPSPAATPGPAPTLSLLRGSALLGLDPFFSRLPHGSVTHS